MNYLCNEWSEDDDDYGYGCCYCRCLTKIKKCNWCVFVIVVFFQFLLFLVLNAAIIVPLSPLILVIGGTYGIVTLCKDYCERK